MVQFFRVLLGCPVLWCVVRWSRSLRCSWLVQFFREQLDVQFLRVQLDVQFLRVLDGPVLQGVRWSSSLGCQMVQFLRVQLDVQVLRVLLEGPVLEGVVRWPCSLFCGPILQGVVKWSSSWWCSWVVAILQEIKTHKRLKMNAFYCRASSLGSCQMSCSLGCPFLGVQFCVEGVMLFGSSVFQAGQLHWAGHSANH